MNEPVSTSRDIVASAEQLYAMVSDVTRMREWSPENRNRRGMEATWQRLAEAAESRAPDA